LQAGDDAESVFILKKNEIHPEKFGLDSIHRGVEKWLAF
jgi:hypothetical protein